MSEDIKSHLLVEKKGRIAYVTLNRPEVLNALTEAHWQQLANTWRALDDDPDVWVIIITGSGERAFCTGQDLKDVASEGPDAWRSAYSWRVPRVCQTCTRCTPQHLPSQRLTASV